MAVCQVRGIKNPEHRLPCSLLQPTALLGTHRSYRQNAEPDMDGQGARSSYSWTHKMGSGAKCIMGGGETTMGEACRAEGRK